MTGWKGDRKAEQGRVYVGVGRNAKEYLSRINLLKDFQVAKRRGGTFGLVLYTLQQLTVSMDASTDVSIVVSVLLQLKNVQVPSSPEENVLSRLCGLCARDRVAYRLGG
ncbi:hypothetical protein HZH68_007082 [Vespula germanica]|uniref:Uncharacterized protein n=1 Tax=Vespula germanica TaxID=30212 RepID=A0A834K8D9_VESGE|nr:hypothetical protein HZH68_007082 [Vespula germanica]